MLSLIRLAQVLVIIASSGCNSLVRSCEVGWRRSRPESVVLDPRSGRHYWPTRRIHVEWATSYGDFRMLCFMYVFSIADTETLEFGLYYFFSQKIFITARPAVSRHLSSMVKQLTLSFFRLFREALFEYCRVDVGTWRRAWFLIFRRRVFAYFLFTCRIDR